MEDRFLISGKVEERTSPMEEVVTKIVSKYCTKLDNIVAQITAWTKDESNSLTDKEVEDILINLPCYLYEMASSQELVGLQSDIANQIHKESYSEAFNLARGTVKDKESVADLTSRGSQLEKQIFERSYKLIKLKMEMAIETLNSIKKIHQGRLQQNEMMKFNREL